METKICSKCKADKPIKEFSTDKYNKDGLKNQCKQCWSDYYKLNKKHIRETCIKWNEKNPEKIKIWVDKNKHNKTEYNKKYFQEHMQQSYDNHRKWTKNNKERESEYQRKSYLKHKKTRQETHRIYNKNNKDKIRKRSKKHYLENKDKKRKYAKQWREENREEFNKRFNARRKTDIGLKIKLSLRGRLAQALNGTLKFQPTLDLLGCSIDFLKKHLEKQFTKGMTWDNYGLYGWHIDHRKPCAKFDLSKESEQKACFSWRNLQPLWAKDNLSKGSKYEKHTC